MPFIPTGFPPYEYRPYPRWLTLADGSQVVADHAEHEAEIMASQPKPKTKVHEAVRVSIDEAKKALGEAKANDAPEDDGPSKEELEEERKTLFNECISRGIKVHPKSGIAKLKAALA